MPYIKEIRIEHAQFQSDVVAYLKITTPYMDACLYSKIENGHCLTNKAELKALCLFWGCGPTDLYDPDEIDLINCMNRSDARKSRSGIHKVILPKVQFRKNQAACKWLRPEILGALGYENQTDWFNAMVERTKADYFAHLRNMEREAGDVSVQRMQA